MNEETKAGTETFDSSSEIIELRSKQETEMEPTLGETPDVELTLRSVVERIKQATYPILKRVEEKCALLKNRTRILTEGRSFFTQCRKTMKFFRSVYIFSNNDFADT